MTDEAFLAKLAADPADDTCRLVYADWLDEHGHADRATYLRATVEMVRLCGDGRPPDPAAEVLVRLAEPLVEDWRAAVGSRFAVVLMSLNTRSYAGSDVGALRRALGCGLRTAQHLIETLPARLLNEVPFEEAHRVWTGVAAVAAGGVQLLPSEAALPTDARRYRVVATYTEPGVSRHHWARPGPGARVFRDMVATILDISRDDAADRIEEQYVVLAADVPAQDVPEWLSVARAAVPSHSRRGGFRIEIDAELQPPPPDLPTE